MSALREHFGVNAAHTAISIGLQDAFYTSASDPSLMAAPEAPSQNIGLGMKLG